MRTSRTALTALATLPLAVALAACSGGGTGAGPASTTPAAPTSSAPAPAPASLTQSPTSTVDGVSTSTRPTGPATGPAHRPTVADAYDTARSYTTRELDVLHPVADGFTWFAPDKAQVRIRARLQGGKLGPASFLELHRLASTWLVAAVATDDITPHRPPATLRLGTTVTLSGFAPAHTLVRVAVTQDRYGVDRGLAGTLVEAGADGTFTASVKLPRGAASTGSVIYSEDAGSGAGTLRASVVRIRLAAAPPAASCAPDRILPSLQRWFDDPAVELRVASARVLACRNGYAHVIAVPRVNPAGHNQYDALGVYLQDRAGSWQRLDYGSSLDCTSKLLAPACRALGETK